MPRDFPRHLNRQVGFLSRSCELYDRGDKEEAIRIATALRVLFRQTPSSTSLITHLGSPSISLVSTIEPDPLPHPQLNLTYSAIELTAQLHDSIPRGMPDYGTQLVPLATWWDSEIVFAASLPSQQTLMKMTRQKLVIVAANQDGGTHVDSNLDGIYDQMEKGAGLTINFSPDFGPTVAIALTNSHLAALRQIAAEVLMSDELLALQGIHRGTDHTPVLSHTRVASLRRAVFVRWCRDIRVWSRVNPATGENLSSSDPEKVQAELRHLMLLAHKSQSPI